MFPPLFRFTLEVVELDMETDEFLESRRHLMRLWLRDPENAWKTPEALRERWARLYDGVTPETSVFPLEPSIRSASKGGTDGGQKSGGGGY